MKLKTLDEFREFCEAVDEENSFTFDGDAFKVTDSGVRYNTGYRDEANNKCALILRWDKKTGEIDFECDYPEAADDLRATYQGFVPTKNRSFTVYLKLNVKAESMNDAIAAAEGLLKGHKDIKGSAHQNARVAQFGG